MAALRDMADGRARSGARRKSSIRAPAPARVRYTWRGAVESAMAKANGGRKHTRNSTNKRKSSEEDVLYTPAVTSTDHPPRNMLTRASKRRFFTTILVIDLTHDDDSDRNDASTDTLHPTDKARQSAPQSPTARNLDGTATSSQGIFQRQIPDGAGPRCADERKTPVHELIATLSRAISPSRRMQDPLTDKENAILHIASKSPRCAILVRIASAGITLSKEDIRRLCKESWLNDEVINAYVALLNHRNKTFHQQANELDRGSKKRIHCFNTFFYTRITQGTKNEYDYSGVERWTKRAKVDVLECDLIFFPVNISNYHWVLAMVDMENSAFRYWDSMHGPDTAGVLDTLRCWLNDEIRSKHGVEAALKLDIDRWKIDVNTGIPRQTDGGSCGVFTTLFAESLERNPRGQMKVDFSQKLIPHLRKKMQVDLLVGELPPH